jgi:hypothetical protein
MHLRCTVGKGHNSFIKISNNIIMTNLSSHTWTWFVKYLYSDAFKETAQYLVSQNCFPWDDLNNYIPKWVHINLVAPGAW